MAVDASGNLYRFDTSNEKWKNLNISPPLPRVNWSTSMIVSSDGKNIIVIGGGDRETTFHNEVYVVSRETKKWRKLGLNLPCDLSETYSISMLNKYK